MPTILVVDDSEVDRRLVQGLLASGSDPGYRIEFAEDAGSALDAIERMAPDVVITDLIMPGQDGLQLVAAIRKRCAQTPVILITAHGSETLAIEALRRGAAGYVPKSQLGQRLRETVEEILAITRADRSYRQLLAGLELAHCVFHLDNDLSLFDPLVDLAHELMKAVNLSDSTGRFQVGVALKEALLNACYHGNLEMGFEEGSHDAAHLPAGEVRELLERRRRQSPYCDRRIRVEWKISQGEARFVVRDDGRGFDYPTALAASQLDVQGVKCQRGLVLMMTFMDEVSFRRNGREVTMVKRQLPARTGNTSIWKN